MVKLAMKVSCTVENIVSLKTSQEDFEWNLKLQCRNCNETNEKWHTVSSDESVHGQSKGDRSSFNFQIKCKFCASVNTLDIVKDSIATLKPNENDIIDNQTLVVFDCRGVEPVEFEPRGGWIAVGESGEVFEDVDFSEGEMGNCWVGYDSKAKTSVTIDDFKSEFVRV